MKIAKIFAGLISSSILWAGDISAYFIGEYRNEANLTQTLSDNGYIILGSYALDDKDEQKTILFTSKNMIDLSQENGKGFFAIGRAYSNSEKNETRITNPLYFGKAFLGDKLDDKLQILVTQIQNTFPNLKNSSDSLKSDDLSSYKFSFGMPKYNDQVVVAKGEALSEKINKPIFSFKLNDHSTIFGIELDKRTKKFVKKIGTENGLVLPYLILIENSEAKILDPKYYIAVSYPKLTMSEFMKIASIPDAVEKEIAGEFK